MEITFTLIALALVIALAWLILKAIKGVHSRKYKDNPLDIKLTLPIGSRERIIIIHYDNSEYMLGVTTNAISLLDKKTISPDNSVTTDSPSQP